MGEWELVFQKTDDDYLAGISNKGTVKRAYKDKEETAYEILNKEPSEENEIAVKVGEETVHIKLPLSESRCTCPSRSICRHIILGILAVKENMQSEDAGEDEAEEHVQGHVLTQIAEYPLEKIKKNMGTKRILEFINRAKAEAKPEITYASVVTVQPLAQNETVKLLAPLEYSACTCHKREFCIHKAEAVLWCKLEAGQINLDELEQAEQTDYDLEEMKAAARQIKVFIKELFDTGLSRTSENTLDSMERLAIISHNAGLPDFESGLRSLQDSYKKYFKRAASLKIQDLMLQISELYKKTVLLIQAENGTVTLKQGGTFRAEYTQIFDLDLAGIAMEHFVSKNGYEGDTIYFLEENTKKWYTYTQARPVFYDKKPRAESYRQETPWGLQIPFKELVFWHIHLQQAKCDRRGRLSSSKETKGEPGNKRTKQNPLTTADLGAWYYKDFGKLFEERIRAVYETKGLQNEPQPVFLCPKSCERAVFSETEQKLSMRLYDEAKKEVIVEVVYSKSEAETIRYLERLTNDRLPCFFGKIYLRDGRIRMYPLAVFGEKELIENA